MATTVNLGPPPDSVVRLVSVAIAALAILLAALATLTSRADVASPGPGEVIDRLLSARRAHDLDAAARLFDNDATITAATGEVARGPAAVTRMLDQYVRYEPGAIRVTGNEVLWTEAFPIRTPDNLQFQQEVRPELLAEIPRYASVEGVCAVVTDGKIHALTALPSDGERSCAAAEPVPSWNAPLTIGVATGIGLLLWLKTSLVQKPTLPAGQLIQGLRAWHR